MPRKRDFFHTGLNVSRSDLEGVPFSVFGANPTGAQDYFMDLNARISEDGKHWDTPVNTLEEAIALSNASIGLATNRCPNISETMQNEHALGQPSVA